MEVEEVLDVHSILQQELEILDGIYELDDEGDEDGEKSSDHETDLQIMSTGQLKDKSQASSSHELNETLVAITQQERTHNFIGKSATDKKELETVHSMYGSDSEGCCSKKCNKQLPKNIVCQFREDFHDLSKDEQDLCILSHLEAHRQDYSLKKVYDNATKKKYTSRVKETKLRRDTIHAFRGVEICKKMYFFIHDIGIKRYKNLIRHFDINGLSSRTHGLTGKIPNCKSHVTPELRERMVEFIKAYANHVAVPLPGRFPQFKDCKVMKLPSSESKISVYRRYVQACDNDQEKMVSDSVFYKLWNISCPYITCIKPADDLCDICQQNSIEILMSSNEDVEKKQQKLRLALDHLQRAKAQRDFYTKWCKRRPTDVASSFAVYSFDFAQDVCYPCSPQQMASSYFKSARKCSIFGILDEITKIQINFLMDEEINVGKGPNSVISMLHHMLETSPPVDMLTLFADNSVVQNKNIALLQYLSWRTTTKRNKIISLNFLITGHTKFGPDRMFSLIKLKYWKSTINCFDDLVTCVDSSSYQGFNKSIRGSDVEYRKWDKYFKLFNRTLPDITDYHHFTFEEDSITCKKFLDSDEEKFHLMLSELPENILPDVIQIEGLRLERQWYLFDNIRDLCTDPSKKDKVAPKPQQELKAVQRAIKDKTETNEELNSKKRKIEVKEEI